MTIFEKASKKKLRFNTDRGVLAVEDLWDLSLADLDKLFGQLSQSKDAAVSGSLLETQSREDKTLVLSLDIVKAVFEQKKKDADKAVKAAGTRQKNQQILEIMRRRGDEALEGKSMEELQALLDGDSDDDDD